MSEKGIAALKADREEVLAVARTLSPAEWAQPSDCAGWRVQDVVNHMANVFRTFVDPAALPPGFPAGRRRPRRPRSPRAGRGPANASCPTTRR